MSERDPRITEAQKRFLLCEELEHDVREKCLDDLLFLMGEQWTATALRDRAIQGRPALVVNRMDQFVQQIANAQRQNRVSARVFPVDDGADIETAEVMQGMLRNIEYRSNADWAYDTAEFYAVAMGFGYWLIRKDYTDPKSFDQELGLERITNPFSIYLGPHSNPDGSDADFGFKWADLTQDEYKRDFPKSELASIDHWQSLGDNPPGWLQEHGVRIVEYYYKEYADDTLYMLNDGPVLESKLGRKLEEGQYRDKRPTQTVTVKWCKLTAHEILAETVWEDDSLPIVKVIGNELDINGKKELKGIVRNLKDAQRQYNFMLTAQTESAMDRGHVVVVEGQIEGHEKQWESRQTKNPSVLQVGKVSVGGAPAPMPTRLPPDMSVEALTIARQMAADDLKALTGIYDAALGNKSNETSGRAINSRQQQSDTANFHFQDNLTRSITCSTKKLVNLMPIVYDTARVVRTIGEDDSHKIVKINQELLGPDGQPEIDQKTGKPKKHDFSIGKYDVICTAGPSFATKRKEGAELLIQLTQMVPGIMNAAGDLITKSLDIPYAQEISKRLKPANVQDDEDGKQPIPPEAQQQLEQFAQQNEQLTETVNELQRQIDTKQAELDSREKIVAMQEETKLNVAEMAQNNAAAIAGFREELGHLHKLLDVKYQKEQMEHQAEQADQDRAFQADQAKLAAENQPEPAQV